MSTTFNVTAFGTSAISCAGAISCAIAAARVASAVSTVAFTIFALSFSALAIASVTAWVKTASSPNPNLAEYFKTLSKHLMVSATAIYQLTTQILVQSIIQGIAEGLSKKIKEKISGPEAIHIHHHHFSTLSSP